MPAPADVSVVIPSWNGRHLLERFLPSVITSASAHQQATGGTVEIVVVDDGSTDDSVDWLTRRTRTAKVPLRIIVNHANLGFGAACSRGVLEARSSLVLLLNNDVALDADAIARLAAHLRHSETSSPLFAVHCRVVDFDTNALAGAGQLGSFRRGFIRVHERYSPQGAAAGPWPSMFASGGSSMVDRKRFLELGGFDPLFAPFYLEDVELSYRAWKRGLRVGYAPDSVARHQFSSTIGKSASAGRIRRISQRNRLFLNWIHLHDRSWFIQHLLWVVVLFVTSPLTLRFDFALGAIDALGQLPEVRRRRREERQRALRTDRDVMDVFER
ncbi:MAG TPA: glycosyltransferase family 2 protein [Vicinamibacterales bacterium]|nr:glycosyltransferase family 2 protein [Vicinamibacterales bacterium]